MFAALAVFLAGLSMVDTVVLGLNCSSARLRAYRRVRLLLLACVLQGFASCKRHALEVLRLHRLQYSNVVYCL
jgi:hypothetical protein